MPGASAHLYYLIVGWNIILGGFGCKIELEIFCWWTLWLFSGDRVTVGYRRANWDGHRGRDISKNCLVLEQNKKKTKRHGTHKVFRNVCRYMPPFPTNSARPHPPSVHVPPWTGPKVHLFFVQLCCVALSKYYGPTGERGGSCISLSSFWSDLDIIVVVVVYLALYFSVFGWVWFFGFALSSTVEVAVLFVSFFLFRCLPGGCCCCCFDFLESPR